jgi:hypothetical protein
MSLKNVAGGAGRVVATVTRAVDLGLGDLQLIVAALCWAALVGGVVVWGSFIAAVAVRVFEGLA